MVKQIIAAVTAECKQAAFKTGLTRCRFRVVPETSSVVLLNPSKRVARRSRGQTAKRSPANQSWMENEAAV